MDERRKHAYRFLLYWAMLDIRPITWLPRSWFKLFSPMFWVRDMRRVRQAGAIGDWMHNLALFSSLDFNNFDEEWFWRDFQSLSERYPVSQYRSVFEQRLYESL